MLRMRLLVLAAASIVFANLQFLKAHGRELLLSCGSNATADADGRRWTGDMAPGLNFTLSSPGIAALLLSGSSNGSEILGPVYRSARLFTTTSWYDFTVLPGYYCVRLHFFPSTFGNFS